MPVIFGYRQLKHKNTDNKVSRDYTMLRKWNIQQSEQQQANLNAHTNLSAIHPTQCSFTVWECAASISTCRPSMLAARHNAFKLCTCILCTSIYTCAAFTYTVYVHYYCRWVWVYSHLTALVLVVR